MPDVPVRRGRAAQFLAAAESSSAAQLETAEPAVAEAEPASNSKGKATPDVPVRRGRAAAFLHVTPRARRQKFETPLEEAYRQQAVKPQRVKGSERKKK